MGQKQSGNPVRRGNEDLLWLTRGATAGWVRLGVEGMATHLSIRMEDVVQAIQSNHPTQLQLAGYHKNKYATRHCDYCGLPRMDDVSLWQNRRADAKYCDGKCKDLFHLENNETGLRGEEARKAHQQGWRHEYGMNAPRHDKENPPPKRRRQKADGA